MLIFRRNIKKQSTNYKVATITLELEKEQATQDIKASHKKNRLTPEKFIRNKSAVGGENV